MQCVAHGHPPLLVRGLLRTSHLPSADSRSASSKGGGEEERAQTQRPGNESWKWMGNKDCSIKVLIAFVVFSLQVRLRDLLWAVCLLTGLNCLCINKRINRRKQFSSNYDFKGPICCISADACMARFQIVFNFERAGCFCYLAFKT